jgi:hypothetical protein
MPTDIPAVVHYMTNIEFKRNPKAKMPLALLQQCFQPAGDFNTVWGPSAGIRLRLLEAKDDTYSLQKFDYFAEHELMPNPASDWRLFLEFTEHFNVRPERGKRAVLDVYVFSGIDVFAGYAVPPRLPSQHWPRPGAIWLDEEWVDLRNRSHLFAHELGHYLGLRHPCHRAGGPETDSKGNVLPTCTAAEAGRLMAPGATGNILLQTELDQASARAIALFP